MATKKDAKCKKCCDTRTEIREKCKSKRKSVRSKLRGLAVCLIVGSMAILSGCATATPSSKSQTSTAKGNVITINFNLYGATNKDGACTVPGYVSFTLSDLLGTQVQSADAGGNESVSQTASPSNTSGVTGDKPIDTIGDVGKAAITGGASKAVSTVKDAIAGAAEKSASSAAGCSTGTCSDNAK